MRLALVLLLLLAPIGHTSRTICVAGRLEVSANRMSWPFLWVFIPNPACHR